MKLVVPKLTTAVTELMDKIYDINEDVVFPKVVKTYYKEGATCPEFSWDKQQRLEIERLAVEYGESSKQKDIPTAEIEDSISSANSPITETEQSELPEQDQEGSTMDETVNTSLPNTPSMT